MSERGLFEGRGPLAMLLMVLLGGLALNLTPCVLPMIPINLAIIGAGAQAGSRQRGFLLGLDLRRGHGRRLRRARAGRHPHRQHLRHHQRLAVVQPRHRRALRRARPGDVRRLRDRLLALRRHGRRRRRAAARSRSRSRMGGGRGAAGRGVRGAGGDPGRAVRRATSMRRHQRGAGAAVRAGYRHGHSVADRRRRPVVVAQARAVDGAGEAGVRRADSGHGGLLRLPRPTACSPIAGSTPPRCRRASRTS